MNFLAVRLFMRVTCHCGLAFKIEPGRFPHRVSCHACGRKFLALEDGQTAPWDPGRSLHVRCRCGHQFDVWTEQYPYMIHCHCGQRFSVLDTGETIGGEAPPVPAAVASVSIQSNLHIAGPASTSVAEKTVAERIAVGDGSAEPKTLDEALSLLDRQWEAEKYRLRRGSVLGFWLRPLWILGVFGGLLVLVSFLFCGGIAFPFVAEILMMGAVIILQAYDEPYGDSQRYANAEEAWRRQRSDLLVKYAGQNHEA
jgi:hypothetical protein